MKVGVRSRSPLLNEDWRRMVPERHLAGGSDTAIRGPNPRKEETKTKKMKLEKQVDAGCEGEEVGGEDFF